jgi:hypothetical protein
MQCDPDHVTYPDFHEADTLITLALDANSAPGSLVTWQATAPPYQSYGYDMSSLSITSINIWLTDDIGRFINPFTDWSMTLRFEFYNSKVAAPSDPDMLNLVKNLGTYIKYYILKRTPPIEDDVEFDDSDIPPNAVDN